MNINQIDRSVITTRWLAEGLHFYVDGVRRRGKEIIPEFLDR